MNIDQIKQIERTDSSGTLILHCVVDGAEHQLVFPGPMAQGLLSALMAVPAPKAGEEMSQPPMQPSGMSGFRMSTGQRGIAFHFPNGHVIQFSIPKEATNHLRALADQLESMA